MKENFYDIIGSSRPVLVDFSAEWCGPCRMMAPVLEQLKRRMGDRVRILKIDVDQNPDLASKYNIRSVPTLILFVNGVNKWSGSGVMTSDYLENVINSFSNIITYS
ncbi:MAG TPA: thioredoxin [Bacteroidales bacterium]|nr:thioredoxin [Bacteroidales bacterium]HRR94194.1 thioredoxin [Bacteroidales bacterium]HRT90419.1 thioredoxin [Bacteroidales bacterium]